MEYFIYFLACCGAISMCNVIGELIKKLILKILSDGSNIDI